MRMLLFFTLIIAALHFSSGCANIIPPMGGPRDSLPPVLVRATPGDSAVNFRGNRITLEFDEFIDLKDVQNNLLFTPIFGSNPVVEARLRTVTIRMRDSLEPNTTYSFDFGNAITDFNEGNPLRGFRYIFSTGPALDTGTLTGRVVLAETGTVDTTLTVVLHSTLDDSAIVRLRPRYAARVDRTGAFRFQNLPRDTFAIYALGDAGITRRYLSGTQLFAFADSALIVGSSAPVTLYAWRAEEERERQAAGPALPGLGRGAAGAADRRLRYTTNAPGDVLDLQSDLILTFPLPLRTFDSAGIALYRDSAFNRVPLTAIALDTSRTELRLSAPWTEATRYALVLQPTFAEDTGGRRLLRADTLRLNTRARSEYGNLTLRFRNLRTGPGTTVLLIQNGQVAYSGSIASGVFTRALLLPGEYELRILEDENGNGRWDRGSFPDPRRQPERVRPVERRITVKPASDNEFELLF